MTKKGTGHDERNIDQRMREKVLSEFIESCRRRGNDPANIMADGRSDKPIPDLLYILWDISQSLRRIADRVALSLGLATANFGSSIEYALMRGSRSDEMRLSGPTKNSGRYLHPAFC